MECVACSEQASGAGVTQETRCVCRGGTAGLGLCPPHRPLSVPQPWGQPSPLTPSSPTSLPDAGRCLLDLCWAGNCLPMSCEPRSKSAPTVHLTPHLGLQVLPPSRAQEAAPPSWIFSDNPVAICFFQIKTNVIKLRAWRLESLSSRSLTQGSEAPSPCSLVCFTPQEAKGQGPFNVS